jgi:hypothetical protein
MQEDINAVAGAVEEVAKAGGKSIDLMQQFGGFISEFTREPLKAASGIIANKLNYIRWEQTINLMVKSRAHLKKMGFDSPPHAVPMNFAIPLLEAASLEENDDLQALWAILLVNAATSSRANDRRRAYISILEQLTPLDAAILIKVHLALEHENFERGVLTKGLPDHGTLYMVGEVPFDKLETPTDEVVLSLANLVRIGCLDSDETFRGSRDYRVVYGTVLGRAFVEAVTLPRAS